MISDEGFYPHTWLHSVNNTADCLSCLVATLPLISQTIQYHLCPSYGVYIQGYEISRVVWLAFYCIWRLSDWVIRVHAREFLWKWPRPKRIILGSSHPGLSTDLGRIGETRRSCPRLTVDLSCPSIWCGKLKRTVCSRHYTAMPWAASGCYCRAQPLAASCRGPLGLQTPFWPFSPPVFLSSFSFSSFSFSESSVLRFSLYTLPTPSIPQLLRHPQLKSQLEPLLWSYYEYPQFTKTSVSNSPLKSLVWTQSCFFKLVDPKCKGTCLLAPSCAFNQSISAA